MRAITSGIYRLAYIIFCFDAPFLPSKTMAQPSIHDLYRSLNPGIIFFIRLPFFFYYTIPRNLVWNCCSSTLAATGGKFIPYWVCSVCLGSNDDIYLLRRPCTKNRAKGVHLKMRNAVRIALLVINIICFLLIAIFGVTGIVYEILGPAGYQKMLAKLKIPWSFQRIWTFMFICLVILIVTYFLRKKFFGA